MKKSVADYTNRPLSQCTNLELFNAVLHLIQDRSGEVGCNEGKKKLYYISAEFLIGKLLSNNLINLRIYDDVKKELEAAGKNLTDLEEFENEPSLGNGGLGRLASCFLDSCATLGLPADGIGLAYHFGLFKQVFSQNLQTEIPDTWLRWGQESFLKRTDRHYTVCFGDKKVISTMYELDVTGYHGKSGRLRLFDLDTIDERLIREGIRFDKNQIEKNLTLFLYPDDSDDAGRILRIYQEYFMVSNGAQLILEEAKARGSNLHDLADYAAVQINDTHPSMVIPELIRLLGQEGIDFEEAVDIVTNVCAYTNHTILAEALETWPRRFLEEAVPQLLPVIDALDEKVRKLSAEPFVQIIDQGGNIHMANMDIHFSHSTNGVAALHTEILKNSELAPFAKMYPERFNNKTNGITFRRWIRACNPDLSDLISNCIGHTWKHNADELEQLLLHVEDDSLLKRLSAVKKSNKTAFADWLVKHQGTVIDPNTLFLMQSKRLHEYKRQQMNLLWAIRTYLGILNGETPARPVTLIFGAKAAPAYTIAKDIIHAILCLQEIVEKDSKVNPWLKIVMIENYNVSAAEKMIPACDISEQISLASREASGTGNMKYMLNGAVTLGTMDGANVEIAGLVGEENIYTFGDDSDTVIARYKNGSYKATDWYRKNTSLKTAVDFLVDEKMFSVGSEENLRRLHRELTEKDYFMTFPDFEEYCETKDRMIADTLDEKAWMKKVLVNIAKAGYFSSDRTIRQYNDEIWHLN